MVLDFFSIFIYLLIVLILCFIIKTYFKTVDIKKKGIKTIFILNEKFYSERNKLNMNYEKSKLVNDFNDSIFNRILVIVNELLSVQKIILDK